MPLPNPIDKQISPACGVDAELAVQELYEEYCYEQADSEAFADSYDNDEPVGCGVSLQDLDRCDCYAPECYY